MDKRNNPSIIEPGMTTLGESGLPLLAEEIPSRKPFPIPIDDSSSERDSGTGDSKRSFDNIENVVDTVLNTFLTARGEREGEEWGVSPPPLSDVDTGISSSSGRHRDGCPNGSYSSCHLPKPVPTPVPPSSHNSLPPSSHPSLTRDAQLPPGCTRQPSRSVHGSECSGRSTSVRSDSNARSLRAKKDIRAQQHLHTPPVETISLAVENPLYDSLPVNTCDIINRQRSPNRPPSPSASLISDSIAYCGRFPAADRRMCPQCGELLAECPHRDMIDEISSVSSAGQSSTGQSSAPSTTMSDQPISFNSFLPKRGTGERCV